jgi:hypothetical protein
VIFLVNGPARRGKIFRPVKATGQLRPHGKNSGKKTKAGRTLPAFAY